MGFEPYSGLVGDLPSLPEGWHWQRLSDLVDPERGICYGIVQPGRHDPEGVPMVNTGDVFDGYVAPQALFRVSKDLHHKFRRSTLRGGEILVTLVGANFGRVAIAPNHYSGNNCSRAVGVVPVLDDAEYVMFALRSPLARHFMDTWANTTAQPTFNLKDLGNLPVPLPPEAAKKYIKEMLKALDDRITLLRETNATLEAIAQGLFKSWFVDFDPVRAKAEGRQPEGMDAATAALFPDSFEESELGLVPRGWRIGTVEDLCSQITNGGTPSRSRKDFWDDGSIPWFKTGEFCDGFLLEPSERITEAGVNGSSVKVLPKDAVLMAIYAAPTVGRLGILTESSTFNQACTGMIAKDFVGPWFLFLTLFFGRNWFNSRANGAAQQNISKAIVAGYSVVIPDERVLSSLNEVAGALFSKIRAGAEQAQTLTHLRDTLLPRLISGQLRLPEAEALVEEAVGA